jgi:hypothetical protein
MAGREEALFLGRRNEQLAAQLGGRDGPSVVVVVVLRVSIGSQDNIWWSQVSYLFIYLFVYLFIFNF